MTDEKINAIAVASVNAAGAVAVSPCDFAAGLSREGAQFVKWVVREIELAEMQENRA